jgi:acyl-CoA synthetase (AMP-forming)/AMP-acid ligase II
MFEALIDNAPRPEAAAFRIGARRVYSYRQKADDVRRCATWLGRQNLDRRARAVIHVADPYLHWVLFFALEARGAISVPEAVQTRIDGAYLERVGSRIVFSSEPDPRLPGVKWAAIGPGFRTVLAALRPLPLPPRKLDPEDPVCIVLSSGTTGAPKKVLLTRRLLERRTLHAREAEFLRPGARLSCLLPYQSMGGILSALQTWLVAGTLVFAREIEWAHELSSGGIDNLVATPIHLARVLDSLPNATPRPAALTIFCGGATPPPALLERLEQRLASETIVAYGTTETGIVTKGTAGTASAAGEATGSILPWMRVETVDRDGRPVPLGAEGEIRVAGEDVVSEYCESPEETATYFRGGWYYPGDLGIVDRHGHLTVTGRVDDLINIGGRKLPAAAVEAAVLKIPGVSDAAAFSTVDAEGMSDLWIAYFSPAPIDVALLQQAVPQVPRIKAARLPFIPRNPMGKIERAALRQKAQLNQLKSLVQANRPADG